MGYSAVLLLGGIILIIVVIGLVGGAKKIRSGKLPEDAAKPQGKPSADEPTPARSVVESRDQVEQARKHTPPA
jgi:hypothetical protein